jgi:hypothetical protein
MVEMRKSGVFLVLLLASSAALGGCVVAAVGAGAAGTVAYIMGDLQTVEVAKLDDVYEAAEKAVVELELSVTSKTKDAMSAEIIARDSQDKKVKIKLVATAEGGTKLSIRVGTFGNETKSRLVYEQIKKNL